MLLFRPSTLVKMDMRGSSETLRYTVTAVAFMRRKQVWRHSMRSKRNHSHKNIGGDPRDLWSPVFLDFCQICRTEMDLVLCAVSERYLRIKCQSNFHFVSFTEDT